MASNPEVVLATAGAARGTDPAGQPAAARAATAPPASILIVDDEPQNRRLLETLLRREGYVTFAVANGEEALAAIAQRAPDLILLDIKLPGINGYQVAGALKNDACTSNIPIIMVTVLIDRDARMSALKAGVEELVTKPIDPSELVLRVRNLLRLKAYGDLLQNHGERLEQQVRARTAELQRFSSAMDATADAIYLVDRNSMRFIHVNDAACRMQGQSREALLARGPADLLSVSRAELEHTYDSIIASGVDAEPLEILRRRDDGSQVWVEIRRHALGAGDGWTIVTLVRDVTERRKAADRIAHLHRVYAVRSGINGAIVRIHDRQELFGEACRIAVEAGAFAKAWIGTIEPLSRQFKMVSAHGGDPLFFQALEGELAKKFRAGQGLVARAAASLQPVISNDAASDPEVLRKDDTAAGSVRSIALLPLVIAGAAVGVLALNSETPQFFDTEEVSLLAELARDIAFAIDHIDRNEKLDRMTRVNAVLSGINALIVRARNRDELFREACLIAIEQGQFKMAWIGVVNRSAMKIEPVASAGSKPDYLSYIKDHFALDEESPAGLTMTARAVLAKKALFSNDTHNDPGIKFKKEQVESGTRSLGSIPLLVADEAVGVLCLYTEEADFFDAEEIALLVELARNIAFAIDHIGKQERLDYLAYYDALTGLANRSLFLERVALYMRSAVSAGCKLGLFFLDLERFRNINDSLGRTAGDALLKQVAVWLTQNVGDANLLARVGGDQFAIVLPEVRQDSDVAHLLEKRIRAFLDQRFRLDATEVRIAIRVGVALFPNDGTDADTVLRNAETALKKAKARGDSCLFYTQAMNQAVAGNLTLENQLRRALESEEFVLHYQPKVNLDTGKLAGAEALIRWNDPHKGLVPPGQFIPILEETGLIHDVGRWALRKAIEQYLRSRAAGLPAVRIAVNVSPLQLRSPGFITEVKQAISVDAQAAAGLELEITESLIMDDVENNIATLEAIRDMGVTIAIDDFGTGFSSLSYLAKLPVDTLKIDRSFVFDMMVGPVGLALVSTIINLAHALKLKTVAEGVETEEQSRMLRLLKCDEMQGFLFSKPVSGETFETMFLVAPLSTAKRKGGQTC